MTERKKSGQKPQAKTWDDEFRVTFRTNLEENADMHFLVFLAGDKLNKIIQLALHDFIEKHDLNLDDQELHSFAIIESAKHYAANKKYPTATELFAGSGQFKLIEELMRCTNQPQIITQSNIKPNNKSASINKPVVECEKQEPPISPSQKTESEKIQQTVQAKSISQEITKIESEVKQRRVIDFGGGDAGLEDVEVKKPSSLRDSWMRNHNY